MPNTQGDIDDRVRILGAHVRRLREGAGMNQAELARQAGIGRTSLHGLETGTRSPTFATLLQIADALGIGIHLLIPPFPPGTPPLIQQNHQGPKTPHQ